MYARVVTWEGGEGDAIRSAVSDIGSRSESGPPEGVPAVGFLLLMDPEGGRTIAVSLFATEDDMKVGDETLNSMSPPGDGLGTRGSVGFYEVGVDMRTD
jgi:hypothetical protein